MKTGLSTTLTGFLVAADAVPVDLFGPIAKLASTAAIAVILFWLVTKTMPAQAKAVAEDNKNKDRTFAAAVKEIAERQHADSVKLNDTLNTLMANCAAVQAARNKGD